jgi:hypothetical protein
MKRCSQYHLPSGTHIQNHGTLYPKVAHNKKDRYYLSVDEVIKKWNFCVPLVEM